MKKHLAKITILLSAIISVLLVSCTGRNTKQYYKSPNGKVVTVWKDYIIFGKYEDKNPPKENFIQMHYEQYQPDVLVTFKSNDSVILCYNCGKNDTLDINFNDNYKVKVFGPEYYYDYVQRKTFSDTLVTFEFSYTTIYDLFDRFFVGVRECVGDSVYSRLYRNNTHNYKDRVYSRYE